MTCLPGFLAPLRPRPCLCRCLPWLTVPPGSCPWFLMIVTLLLRALNPKTPGSDSRALPWKPFKQSSRGAALTSCHPCRARVPREGWSSFFQGGSDPPRSSLADVSLRAHTLALKHRPGMCSTTTQTLQVAHPSWGSGPKGSLAFTVADGTMELRQGPRLHNLRAPVFESVGGMLPEVPLWGPLGL